MINEDDDDFLNAARRERGALPSGEYVAEIVPGSVVPFTTPQTRGCTVRVKICAGDHCGRESSSPASRHRSCSTVTSTTSWSSGSC